MIKIDSELLTNLIPIAENSPRKRINYNFHKESNDPIQRLLNVMEPDTYIRPHKHEKPDKREVFIVIKGSFIVIEFDNDGNIMDNIILRRDDGVYATEIASRRYHTIISLEKGSVVYEFKDGPYDPANDKDFAPWAPDEKSGDGQEWNRRLLEKINIPPEAFQE